MARKPGSVPSSGKIAQKRINIDEGVAAETENVLSLGSRAAAVRRRGSMTKAQKEKAKKDKNRDSLRIDTPEELHDLIKAYATAERVSISRLVCFLVVLGLKKLHEDKIDLNEFKTHSRSPRFEFNLQLPEMPARSLFVTEFKK